jgi:hypothetical protein
MVMSGINQERSCISQPICVNRGFIDFKKYESLFALRAIVACGLCSVVVVDIEVSVAHAGLRGLGALLMFSVDLQIFPGRSRGEESDEVAKPGSWLQMLETSSASCMPVEIKKNGTSCTDSSIEIDGSCRPIWTERGVIVVIECDWKLLACWVSRVIIVDKGAGRSAWRKGGVLIVMYVERENPMGSRQTEKSCDRCVLIIKPQ